MGNNITTDPNYRTIVIKGDGVRNEAIASGSILPGHLVKLTSAAVDTVAVHGTARAKAPRTFAVEDDLQGKGRDDAYTTSTKVQYVHFRPGEVVNARILNGENIAKGDFLASAGDGSLRKIAVVACGDIIAMAREACDMSGTSGADPSGFCAAEIL